MKKFRKLIPALALLLVSAVLMSTASYAWFSMNTKVAVTGMEVKTKVGSNLAIASDSLDSTAKKADNLFKTTLIQEVTGILEPVSTIEGKTFYYNSTKNAGADGNAVLETYLRYTEDGLADANTPATYNNAFSENYGVAKSDTAVAYVDYVFQVKATNSGANSQEIRLTTLNLTYGGTADTSKAWRVALFVEDITESAPAGNLSSVTATTILTPSGAANQESGKAVGSTSATAALTVPYCANTSTAKIGPIATGATKYYKVVIRLWIEGEDTTCTNATFASLTKDWSLDLNLTLVDTTADASSVQYINQNVTATPLALLTTDAIAGEKTVTINGVDYYAITGKELNSKQVYKAGSGALTTNSHVYLIEDNTYLVDVTNQVVITVGS